jgi:hypothetical protein
MYLTHVGMQLKVTSISHNGPRYAKFAVGEFGFIPCAYRLLDKVTRRPAAGISANGLRYLLAGGRGLGLGAGFRLGVEKSPKMPQNPASQVHAVLGRYSLAPKGFDEGKTPS